MQISAAMPVQPQRTLGGSSQSGVWWAPASAGGVCRPPWDRVASPVSSGRVRLRPRDRSSASRDVGTRRGGIGRIAGAWARSDRGLAGACGGGAGWHAGRVCTRFGGLHPLRGRNRAACGSGLHPVRGFAPVAGAESVESWPRATAAGANPRIGCTVAAPEARRATIPGANPRNGCTVTLRVVPIKPIPGANPRNGCTVTLRVVPIKPIPGANPRNGCTVTLRVVPIKPIPGANPRNGCTVTLRVVPIAPSPGCVPRNPHRPPATAPCATPWFATSP